MYRVHQRVVHLLLRFLKYSLKMRLTQNAILFINSLFIHFVLITIFSLSWYYLYFLALLISLYSLKNLSSHLEYKIFFPFLFLLFIVINLDIYHEYIFELSLYLNIEHWSIYINSEVMYILTLLHLIVLINLKRFEKIWAIIDEKLFRI